MKQFWGHGRQEKQGYRVMLEFLDFRVLAWAFGPQYMYVTMWIIDTWEGEQWRTQDTHTLTMFLTSDFTNTQILA